MSIKYLIKPLEMKQHILKVKIKEPGAILMGLDVGRKFNGISFSDKTLQIAKVILVS